MTKIKELAEVMDNTKSLKEWTMDEKVKDVVFRDKDNNLKTLERIYRNFKNLIKKCTFELPPEQILEEYTEEIDNTRTYIFVYRCTDKEGNKIKNMLVAKTPSGGDWSNYSVHQVLKIMQDMYILKLNEQILI
jgi:hypothetical protein